jgi:hypothetical protein
VGKVNVYPMEEVSAVARARRIQLSDSVVSDRMSYVDTRTIPVVEFAWPSLGNVTLQRRGGICGQFGGATRTGGKGPDPC